MSDRLNVLSQYLFPKQALTTFSGKIANARAGRLTTALIRWFVGRYGVNMEEAANPDIGSYATFNEFFTRALRAGARPLAGADYICPVDGAISQFGAIDDDQIVQAKGHSYSVAALVGGDGNLAAQFQHGSFATLYLSPRGLPPRSHALRRPFEADDFRSRCVVFGQPGYGAGCARSLRSQ